MLDAAVPGAVFTSPTPEPIFEATKAVDGGAGVLHIVKNYTGDVLNFETAAELAEAEDITVRSVVVNDDVAVEDSLYTAGRRGVAGTVLVEKIAGAAAERGDDLDAVVAVAQKVIDNVRSMGVALTPCTVPHAGKPSFDLGEDEIEIGIGIHGEPGRHRVPMASRGRDHRPAARPRCSRTSSSATASRCCSSSTAWAAPRCPSSTSSTTTPATCSRTAGLSVSRSLVGNYITSLEMQGASVTVLRLDDELTTLWDAPVNTPALRRGL